MDYILKKINRTNIIDLDSSTNMKFSRHLIEHLPSSTLFANSASCGKFVKNFVVRLVNEIATGVLAIGDYSIIEEERLFRVHEIGIDKRGISSCAKQSKTCIVDLGVNTRNRIFHILASKKYGKDRSAALRVASTNQYN